MIKKTLNKYLNRETVSYLICGVLTTIVGIGVFWICEVSGLHVAVSNTISTAAAVSFAYFVNKIFVFRSASWKGLVLAREIFTFITGRFASYVMETLLLVLLVNVIGLPGFACKLFTSVLVVIANYLISKKAVFVN
jgi:putative flippase GtrA